ncbi:MAG: IS110 family transposase [Hyphomicrobiales bacterium]|nr:IS110 family transposase [Hyphomicrobiales bacterium]
MAAYPGDQYQQFTNNNKGHKALVRWLSAIKVKLIVFEATGAYHHRLERFLGDRGLAFSKVNPRQARQFAQATGKLAKTDRVDALMLAKFGELMEPPHSVIKSQTLAELGELVIARHALAKDRTAAKNRQHNIVSPLLKRQVTRRLRQIKADIKAIDEACEVLVKADEGIR